MATGAQKPLEVKFRQLELIWPESARLDIEGRLYRSACIQVLLSLARVVSVDARRWVEHVMQI
jgi:hypothetical protein